VPVASFQRLAKSLASHAGEITYAIQGQYDRQSHIKLSLSGVLVVICQRCISELLFPIKIETTLTLFFSEEAIDDAEALNPDIEGILFDKKLDLMTLIEDELILALPMTPMHDICIAPSVEETLEEVYYPFAALAKQPAS
jgi:uncharacterized protein